MSRVYCKAYHLKDLRQFHNWSERARGNEADLAEEAIVYLWDDFTVVKTPVSSEAGLLWDEVTSDWQEFCRTTLGFEIPEDLRYAYEESTGQDMVPAEAVVAQDQNGA
ncbi:MAG TPA: hypothetical protein VH164_01425 [Ktedonobacteraceae bacterium]|jgi:hypothetical protein|nr:hypothetical protein [Ktedonobacteraceae bacterium]